jgi:hypothetical protein
MKNRLKILIMAVVATVSLSGCTKLWEEEWNECVPLLETGIPVIPDQWESSETDEEPVGD